MRGKLPHEQDSLFLSCGDWRAPAGASGGLPRDMCGMRRCLNRELNVNCVRGFAAVALGVPVPKFLCTQGGSRLDLRRWKRAARAR
jgi:hypothetical protein